MAARHQVEGLATHLCMAIPLRGVGWSGSPAAIARSLGNSLVASKGGADDPARSSLSTPTPSSSPVAAAMLTRNAADVSKMTGL